MLLWLAQLGHGARGAPSGHPQTCRPGPSSQGWVSGASTEGKGHLGDFAVTRIQGMGCDLRALTPTWVLLWDWPGLKLNQIVWLPLLGEAGCPGKRTLARVRIQTLIPLLTVQVPLAESLVSGPQSPFGSPPPPFSRSRCPCFSLSS